MHRLVPDFILQQYGSGKRSGNFPATTLFVDVSGFSAITDMLIESGSQHGAEVLAGVMRAVFDPLVTAVYDRGGFIVGFAGDAFMAVFPRDESGSRNNENVAAPDDFHHSSLHALAAAWAIQQHMAASADHDTPYGRFTLSTKVGMALGEVAWGIVTSASGNRASYYFQGTAVDRCAAAEHLAQAGEVVAHAEVHAALADRMAAEAVGDYYRITSITGVLPSPRPVSWGAPDPALVAAFFPETVTRTARTGEFRQVVNLFIGLPTVRTAAQVDIFMQIVFALQDRYGGLLNRLDFGDKGAHLLLFWGAPVAFENDVQRALNFVLDLQTQTAIPIKAGMTYRRAHAGHIGSPRHEEYTCYGRGVNLAARFMMAAPRGEIWVDEYVARRASGQFNLDFEGKMAFKGFARQQKVYVLFERREQAETYYEGELVGREAELQALTEFVQPIFD
ncbi:MAG TPA: adenylate/guanylate cyclase domain-containing protein, partial [Anaerolineae bacterium]